MPSGVYGRMVAFLRGQGLVHSAQLWLRMARIDNIEQVPQHVEQLWRDALARAETSSSLVTAGSLTADCRHLSSVLDAPAQTQTATVLPSQPRASSTWASCRPTERSSWLSLAAPR